MRLSCHAILGAALLVVGGCAPASQSTLGGAPVAPPVRLVAGTSCPSLRALQRTPAGDVVALLTEQAPTGLSLGLEHLEAHGWAVAAKRQLDPDLLVWASLTPDGDAFAAAVTSTALSPFELTRVRDAHWEQVPFAEPLDGTRQNFPALVALDADRAVLTLWETGGSAPSRQRAYLLTGDGSTALEDWLPTEVRHTFHRGPAGQVWRVTYEGEEGSATARFEEWTGAAWTDTGLTIATGTAGYFRRFLPTSDGFTAFFDSTHSEPGGYGGILYDVRGTVAQQLAVLPSPDVGMIDIGRDGAGRLIVVEAALTTDPVRTTVRVLRLAGSEWETLVDGTPGPRALEGRVGAVIDGDSVLIGWTESDQRIDIGFQRYTDCALRMARLPL